MTTEQFLINSLSDTFAQRCDYFIGQNDLANAKAIYEEWVVNGIDPEDESIDYEWCFISSVTLGP
jgi:hypothetical protein